MTTYHHGCFHQDAAIVWTAEGIRPVLTVRKLTLANNLSDMSKAIQGLDALAEKLRDQYGFVSHRTKSFVAEEDYNGVELYLSMSQANLDRYREIMRLMSQGSTGFPTIDRVFGPQPGQRERDLLDEFFELDGKPEDVRAAKFKKNGLMGPKASSEFLEGKEQAFYLCTEPFGFPREAAPRAAVIETLRTWMKVLRRRDPKLYKKCVDTDRQFYFPSL